jgi:osmotically-inducible protein OsmY
VEETDPDDIDLPPSVDNNAFDLQEDIYITIRNNSETSNLADRIRVNVVDGVVILEGIVPDDLDVANIDDIVSDLEGVEELDNRLETEV